MRQEIAKGILIVTDKPEFRALVETFFSRNYDVIMSENALEAYTLLENGYMPELIITEFTMSLPDGKNLIVKIKGNNKYLHIPILALSGSDREFARVDLIRTGSTGHIVKPFRLTDLETRVRSLLKITI